MKTFYNLKNVLVLPIFLLAFNVNMLGQTPQYYNYATVTNTNYFPFAVATGKEIQWLVLAHEFNQPSQPPIGNITKLYIYMGGTSTNTFTNLTIKLGLTTLTSLPTGLIYTGPLDTVYFRSSVTLSSTTGSWMMITLDRPFLYDTSKSLVVDIGQCAATSTLMYVTQTTRTNTRRTAITPSGFCTGWAVTYNDALLGNLGIDISPPPSPFCQGFSSSTFPPLGWNIVGATPLYWLRNGTVSGFGLSTGSAYYNMWNAPVGTNQELRTITFSPTLNPTDSVEYDYAYSPYPSTPPYDQDSLVILSSSNGGTTWVRLAAYGPFEMQTAPAQNGPQFIPTSGQWGINRILLPLGTNKVSFLGKSAFGNDLYIDSVCVKHPVGIQPVTHRVPKVYSLLQNYPNPFNPVTRISYELPRAGNVNLVVRDILGREVITLVNESKQAGSYTVNFDASALASGVYFYNIKSGNFSDTKKMVLIK